MIRVAEPTETDLDAIVQMAESFVAQTNYRRFITINPAATRELAEGLLRRPEDAVILLSLAKSGEPIGLIAMWIYQHPMSTERIASELVWWIDPRHTGTGVKLLKRAEQWAKEHGAVAIEMIAPTERIGRFYEALEYEVVEVKYLKRLAA